MHKLRVTVEGKRKEEEMMCREYPRNRSVPPPFVSSWMVHDVGVQVLWSGFLGEFVCGGCEYLGVCVCVVGMYVAAVIWEGVEFRGWRISPT